MTAWTCDAESDKLISKSLWYCGKKKEKMRKREKMEEGYNSSGANKKLGWWRIGGVRQRKESGKMKKKSDNKSSSYLG